MLPTLSSPRLVLRALHADDAPWILEMGRSDAVMQYIPGVPRSRTLAQATQEIEQRNQKFSPGSGRGFWAAELRDTGDCIGWGLLGILDRTEEPEIGYRLREMYWHQGYATEIATCLRDHGVQDLQLPVLAAVTLPGNTASRRVLEKIGLVYQGEDTFYRTTCSYYRMMTRKP